MAGPARVHRSYVIAGSNRSDGISGFASLRRSRRPDGDEADVTRAVAAARKAFTQRRTTIGVEWGAVLNGR